MFLYRHDKSKLSRLLHFLAWKDVRKNLNEGDERGGPGDADLAQADDAIGAVGGPGGPAAADPKKEYCKESPCHTSLGRFQLLQ